MGADPPVDAGAEEGRRRHDADRADGAEEHAAGEADGAYRETRAEQPISLGALLGPPAKHHPYAAADSSDPVAEVALRMADSRCGSAVVIDDGKLVGIFTTVDALVTLAKLAAAD